MRQYIRVKKVAEVIGISQSSVWRWVQSGLLPKPIKLTNRTTVWRADDVYAAVERLAAESEL